MGGKGFCNINACGVSKDFCRRELLPLWKKITDIYAYRRKKKILMLDSDIIFYRNPLLLVQWAQGLDKKNYFMDDYKNFYALSNDECFNRYGLVPRKRVNSGLICMNPDALSHMFLSEYVNGVLKICEDRLVEMHCSDQTYYALLFNMLNVRKNVSRLPTDYFLFAKHTIGHLPVPENPICIHYTGLFMRSMYTDGLRLLQKERFFTLS